MKKWSPVMAVIFIIFFSSCSPGSNTNSPPQNQIITPAESVSDSKQKKADYTPEDKTTNSNHEPREEKPLERVPQEEPEKEVPLKEIKGLVRIDKLDPDIVIDLKYATEDNFTGRQVYTVPICLLRRTTAEKLIKANNEFMETGHRIKIWDGYRPPYAQQMFWDIVRDPRYVANPKNGSSYHDTGCTVDITLVDANGEEVVMPSAFDDFSIKASRKYTGSSSEAKKNMEYLTEVMKRNGFTTINSEWWEFRDKDIGKYSPVDVKLEDFLD